MNRLRHISLLALIVLVLMFSACRKVEKPDVIIRQEVMTEILTDLYLADGLLNNAEIRRKFLHNDSTENYMRVIEKHGFTMADFDANIEYYLKTEPKMYEEIYDVILATLSEMEAQNIEATGNTDPSRTNLWKGKSSFRMPDDGTANPVEFSFRSKGSGKYTISARLNLFEDDQSVDPKATIYFWFNDGSEEGYMDFWESEVYTKQQGSQTIKFEKVLIDPRITHVKGRLIDFTQQQGHWEMHSSISGIKASYFPEDFQETPSRIDEK
jgi:hypothetical protein